MDGISETERSPVLEWLPTLCFYNVTGAEQVSDVSVDGNHYLISWFNVIVVVCMASESFCSLSGKIISDLFLTSGRKREQLPKCGRSCFYTQANPITACKWSSGLHDWGDNIIQVADVQGVCCIG